MWPEGCSWYAEGEQPLILVSTVSHALTSVGAHGCILDKLVSSTKISQTLQRQLQLPGQGQSSHGKDSQPPKAVTVPQHGMAGSRAPWKMQNGSIWISKTNHIWRGKDIFPARKYFYCRSKAVYLKKIIPFKPLRKEDLNKKVLWKLCSSEKTVFSSHSDFWAGLLRHSKDFTTSSPTACALLCRYRSAPCLWASQQENKDCPREDPCSGQNLFLITAGNCMICFQHQQELFFWQRTSRFHPAEPRTVNDCCSRQH